MQRFYVIYDTKAERIVTAYGTKTCPALYVTAPIAFGILKQRRTPFKGRPSKWDHCEVREVELHIRDL